MRIDARSLVNTQKSGSKQTPSPTRKEAARAFSLTEIRISCQDHRRPNTNRSSSLTFAKNCHSFPKSRSLQYLLENHGQSYRANLPKIHTLTIHLQFDKLVGLMMLIVATTVFLYYTTWTLLMVLLLPHSPHHPLLPYPPLPLLTTSLPPSHSSTKATPFTTSSLPASGPFAYQSFSYFWARPWWVAS